MEKIPYGKYTKEFRVETEIKQALAMATLPVQFM